MPTPIQDIFLHSSYCIFQQNLAFLFPYKINCLLTSPAAGTDLGKLAGVTVSSGEILLKTVWNPLEEVSKGFRGFRGSLENETVVN